MIKVLIVYYSQTGNTEKMAEFVAEGVREAKGEAILKKVSEASLDDLQEADGIICGSPTHYGHSAGELLRFIDEGVVLHGELVGKVGGAFVSSHNIGGGNETAILALLHSFLVHGMVVQGTADGDHYGPVSIGIPDTRVKNQCRNLGKRVVELAGKLKQ